MSSSYERLIPVNILSNEEAKLNHDKILNFLLTNEIINPTMTDCILSEKLGYPPGNNYKAVFESTIRENLKTGGLEITIGRNVFYSNFLDEVNCPKCGENLIESNWTEKLSEWYEMSSDDELQCSKCNFESSVIYFKFNPNWAFGHYGLTFWDWGVDFQPNFVKTLENLIGHKFLTVSGRV